MTDREKLLGILKAAYEPRKIPQEDGSVAIYYPTDEDVADMIWAAIIDEYKHRTEVAERAFLILWNECKEKLGWNIDCTMWYAKQAEKELAEEKKDDERPKKND